ncbi:MAG TPA: DUF885 domain-containing protein [Candidatus Eisenbacteria bacterium]
MPSTPARLLPVAALLAAALAGLPAAAWAGGEDQRFQRLADDFVNGWLARHPQNATRLGLHSHDRELRVVTQSSLAEDAAWLHGLRDRLRQIPRRRLSFAHALDDDVLAARIDRELLDLEVIRPFETNPNAYLDLVAGSIQSLLQRDFASPCERATSVLHRLRQVPEVLREAQVNLHHPPHLYTEVAIGQFAGVLRLYREQVPTLNEGCHAPTLEADLAVADTAAIQAVEAFVDWMRDDLLARSDGDYRLGRETFQRKLQCDELESTPVDSLLARGWRELALTRARMENLAERIAPGSGVQTVLDSMASDHPPAERLIPAIQDGLGRIRAFVRDRRLVTPPTSEHLIVRETPPFRRATSFASMDPPGVWETHATEAYFNVTPVDPAWSGREQLDHLGFFNRWSADIVSIHEAIPGHYYQFLAVRRARSRSRLRQAFGCGTNIEGWAHYCEQLAIEQGYGGGDPRYELAQLELALQRLGRFVVGLSLHTQDMSQEEAVRVFQEQCYMAPVNAEREARRGALDPTYIVYTLGKWRIFELREELRRRMGRRFDLRAFHDAFLRQGPSPLPVVRRALLRELARDRSPAG